jgi:glycosyltransferase involved in cell wall biosynthesis
LRVAYLLHKALPSADTDAEQVVHTAAALARAGIDVTLLAPGRPGRAGPAARAEVVAFQGLRTDVFDHALALRERPAPGPGLRRAALDLVRAARSAREGSDVLYARQPGTFLAALAAGRPVVFETYRTDLALDPRWALLRLALRSPRVAGVVLHSRHAREAFEEAGFDPARLLVAHNGHDPERLAPDLSPVVARRRLGLEDNAPLAVYAGHVGPHKGTDALLALAERLPGVHVLLVGASDAGEAWLEGERKKGPRPNVTVVPRVAPAALAPYLAAADVLLLPASSAPLRAGRTVLPMKTFLYLGAGRPIVGPDLPDVGEVLADGENALLVPPDRPEAAAEAVQRLFDDRDLAGRLAARARRDALRFTWDARAARIAGFLRQRLPAL